MEGLGRRIDIDDRDRSYLMRSVLRPREPGLTYRYWWLYGAWLDQGQTGTCVGHAWAHYVEDGPVTHEGTVDAISIYLDATSLDAWPENDNGDLNFGTSVRAGAKALQARGLISEYRWAWDADTVAEAILTTGPVVVGTWWYTDMFSPDDKGFVKVGGNKAGGHAYILNGVNLDRGIVRFKNSWGQGWGKKGYAYMSLEDLDHLIQENGEACLSTEIASR